MKGGVLLTVLVAVQVTLGSDGISAEENPTRVVEHSFLTVGKPSGSQLTRYLADGSIHISFQFNDRGRGPETETRLRLRENGTLDSLSVSGKNYQKGRVDERFTSGAGRASWRSTIESGEAVFDGKAFYLPNTSAPEITAMLARALLNTPGHALDLLPGGRASIAELGRATLRQDDVVLDITLYGISGVDTSPVYVWLDREREFFGVDNGWMGIIRQGWEAHIDVLKTAQVEATSDYFAAFTQAQTTLLDDLLVIHGARVFDSVQGKLTDPATVFVWQGKIAALYYSPVSIPSAARVIDATGKTLLPALWDMHAHVSVENFPNYLAAGVTNVRDMANDHQRLMKLKTDVRSGRIAGPDMHALGFVDKRGEFSAPTGRLADTLEDAQSFIDFYAQQGYHGIKLYSSIEPGWVEPLAMYAHRRDLVVMGHVPAYMNAEQAIRAGYDEITHINMILLNFLDGETLDTRTPTRFIVPGEKAGQIDLNSRRVKAFVRLMRERGIAHDPTLSIFLQMFRNVPGEVNPTFSAIADHLPASVRRNAIAGASYNAGKEREFAAAADKTMALVKLLHDSGIRLLPGTDNMLPGFTLIRELINYAEAGISSAEVLQLATIESARHLRLDQRLGSITVGKDAQLMIVDGDPIARLEDLYRVEHVIKGRQMYFAPDLLRAQGFIPFGN